MLKRDSLLCQECLGRGGRKDSVLLDGSGPWVVCEWCKGAGKVTGCVRSLWLQYKKQMKNETENEEKNNIGRFA